MKTLLMAILFVACSALAGAPAKTDGGPAQTLRESLGLEAPVFVLAGDAATVLAAKAACTLSKEDKKGLLKTCTYECPCGTRELRRKDDQECPRTWYFDC